MPTDPAPAVGEPNAGADAADPADPAASDATTAASGALVERWLVDLEIPPGPCVTRDGVRAWDIVLDGRRRRDLRATLILDPGLGLIVWAHLAPPIGDAMRKTYRALLRWNDDFPFAKFSVADDGRPILAVEIPDRWLDPDELGIALARIVGIADRVFEETRPWLWIGGRVPAGYAARECRTTALIGRFAPRLPELFDE